MITAAVPRAKLISGRDALLAMLDGKCVQRTDWRQRGLYLGIRDHFQHTIWGWQSMLLFNDGAMFSHSWKDFVGTDWRIVPDRDSRFLPLTGQIDPPLPSANVTGAEALRAVLHGGYVAKEGATGVVCTPIFVHGSQGYFLGSAAVNFGVDYLLDAGLWRIVTSEQRTCPECQQPATFFLQRDPKAAWNDHSNDRWVPGRHLRPSSGYRVCSGV